MNDETIARIVSKFGEMFAAEPTDTFDLIDKAFKVGTDVASALAKDFAPLIIIGALLVVIRWANDLFGYITRKDLTFDNLIVSFIRLAITLIIVVNITEIVGHMLDFTAALGTELTAYAVEATDGDAANGLADTASGLLDEANDNIDSAAFSEDTKDVSGSKSSLFLVLTLIMTTVAKGMSCVIFPIAVGSAAVSRTIRLSIAVVMAPIRSAGFYNGGMHSEGMMYIRELVAIMAEPAVCFLILSVGNGLMNMSATYSAFSTSFEQILMTVALCAMISKTKNISKAIFT